MLITGGVHGDEFEPMAAVRRLALHLKTEILTGTVVLVPVVNEAAFQRGNRTAEDDLDLARVCPGDPHGSPTERVAHELSKLIRKADFYIDLHTGGTACCILPLAGYTNHADQLLREKQRQMAHAFNLPLVWAADPTLNGRSLSVARDTNVPAIYVEHHGAATCDPDGVEAMVDGCLNVLAHVGMLTRSLPPSRVEHDIRETGPDTGYFQGSHLAPCGGFFETSVALGDHVQAGESIGRIVDPVGQRPVEVTAETTGMVICIRTFSSIKKGDHLCYLVETEDNRDD
jgi:uncharacterized protein